MKLGTQIRLPDGTEATAVFNGLEGVGCKLGLHDPDPNDFRGTNGNLTHGDELVSEDWPWFPDVLLREPWDGCEDIGWTREQCVGKEYTVTRDGLTGERED